MILTLQQVLTPEQCTDCNRALDGVEWIDGRVTAGYQSARVKNNSQLPENHPVAQHFGNMILGALEQQPLFISAALPLKVVPPLFNAYSDDQHYGAHVDGAIRAIQGTLHRVRLDLSATLFLSDPGAYDGGDLVIEDRTGEERVKLSAGDLVLYPGNTRHRVEPVTRGVRRAAFFWIQSMVRNDDNRAMLFDLDNSIRDLAGSIPDNSQILKLTHLYHNLLRQWAET